MSDNESENKPKESINKSQNDEENKENSVNREKENKDEENDNKEENDEKKEEEKEEPFLYLERVQNDNIKKEENAFKEIKGKCKFSICILLENNTPESSLLLKQTLISIGKNLSSLKENLDISPQEIYIFAFINETKNDNVLKIANNDEEKNNEFLIQELVMKFNEEQYKELENIQLFTISKLNYLYHIKSLSYYYNNILSQIKVPKKIIFSSMMTSGITFNENKLFELISYSYHQKSKHGIAVSSIEYNSSNLVSKLNVYEKKRFNIYNLNYFSESNATPISSQLSLITINDKMLKVLKNYYDNFKDNIKASIDYHDYNLALHLKQKQYLIKYVNNNPGIMTTLDDFSFYDYQQIYLNRFSGYYGNFFQVLSSFKGCDIIQIPFIIFQLISIFFEFILPSISAMIIYIVFYSAFKTNDYRIALFLSLLYLSLMFSSGYCSLVGKDINKMRYTYFIINILMTLLYFLSLVSSIPAMHFAHEDKNPDFSNYKFNKAAISTIIILTFIPYIIPLILSISSMEIVDFILLFIYNLVFAPLAKVNFNVAGVWGGVGAPGGKMSKERKSIYILLYLLINLFFGSLSFYVRDNKKKANCVMALGIIYLVYNFVRTLAIIFEICFKKEEAFKNQNLMNNIKTDLEEGPVEDDNKSEEKSIKKNEEEDNENNGEVREVEVSQNNNENNINNVKKEETKEESKNEDDI